MGYKVDNAIIMAAGTSSRFAPLSYEGHKGLINVRGEILIERQIRQLKEAGIKEIIIVVGYKKEQFLYLKNKYGVVLIENDEYMTRNNNGSIYAVRDYLKNSYICSSDNYFMQNPFEAEVDESYYATVYESERTEEWCVTEDKEGYIDSVKIGGEKVWYMLGHVFWSEDFSRKFLQILLEEYNLPRTKDLLWESIYMEHLNELKLKIRKYGKDSIFEFDTLDELRKFDESYIADTKSGIIKQIAAELGCEEKDIVEIKAVKNENSNDASGFLFCVGDARYQYDYSDKKWKYIS